MIGVDSNILVYSHRRDSPWYAGAAQKMRELARGPSPWALMWPCVHEFFGIVTHPRVYSPASTVEEALLQIEAWMASPSVFLLHEEATYWPVLRRLLQAGQVVGPRIHDAKIAALCELHGVSEIWTADRDFTRFPNLIATNPLR